MSTTSKLFGKKEAIFVQGQSRDSAIKKLGRTPLTTAAMLDELGHVYNMQLQADGEINQLRKMLAERLEREEFGLRNVDLETNKLQLFVDNTRVFDWFAAEHSEVTDRIQAGLRERLAPPKSDTELVRQLKEENRQLLDLLQNQQNHYPSFDYQLPPRKRLRIAEPEEWGEEPDGRVDRRGEVVLDDYLLFGSDTEDMVEKESRDDTGGEASAATNAVEVVPKDREEMVEKEGRDDTGGEASVATNTVEVVPKHRETREKKRKQWDDMSREEKLNMVKNVMKKLETKIKDATDVEEKTNLKRQLASVAAVRKIEEGRDDKGGPSTRRVDKGKRPE
ncbi:hypothetical protein HK104_005620 [Borealophlyctis nickersoniae]|nr:hypothetical protein HK104_005620 [Borealophlyctis nickersoniae]